MKFRASGVTAKTGMGFTVNMTIIVAGEPLAPGAVTVMCPTYVPMASVLVVHVIVRPWGAVPDAGETPSHGESELAVKFKVPEPVFVTLTFCVGGLGPLYGAENVSVYALRVKIGVMSGPPRRIGGLPTATTFVAASSK